MGEKGRDMAEAPSPLTLSATETLRRLLDGAPSADRLNAALRHLAKWRSALLDNTLTARDGTGVLDGPFKGMAYPVRAAEGARAARVLGAYEAGLEPVIETIIRRAYATVIDIGCAEGYYAVGLARRMPQPGFWRATCPNRRKRCAGHWRRRTAWTGRWKLAGCGPR